MAAESTGDGRGKRRRATARRPTISDVAQRAGVSKVAVSYALNGQPGVSDATRRRILAIAEEIGFSPSRAARVLSGAAAAGAIGLVLSRPARTLGIEPFFMELISGVEATLSARSYGLTLQMTTGPADEAVVYRRWWGERRVDGVLICDLRVDDPRIAEIEKLSLPAVVIGGPGQTGNLASIWSDDAAAVVETVEYLYALGHRVIARVGGVPEFLHTRIRADAFAQVCARLGIAEATSVDSDYSGEEGARITRRLLSSRNRPTAIIYDNDVMAVAGLGVAQEMGLRVPADLSLVAWDDSVLCRLVHPALTALQRDIPAHGARAASMLLDIIDGHPPSAVQDATARLAPRSSTARAPW
ncbi:MAG: LacI family DNA-binding transcriptional regulator [Micromonosporaceae bacterium]|nr:LacI family DNA-binding transcriptional regulator [Micromonosporaceae bacterium]